MNYGIYAVWNAAHFIRSNKVDLYVVTGKDVQDTFLSRKRGTEWYIL